MRVAELSLDVTGLGLVTSVGHDVVTACAAIRAGISRPAPIFEHPVVDIIEREMVPLLGHPLTPVTNGFCSGGRWLQLLPLALDDLIQVGHLDLDPGYWAQTAIVVVLPNLGAPRFEHDKRAKLELLHGPLIDLIGSRLPPRSARVEVRFAGHGGVAELLLDAPQVLRDMEAERLVIVTTDSYVEPFSLEWLSMSGRLKTDENPVGLMPGEVAAAMLLEPQGGQKDRLARVYGAAVAPIPEAHVDEPSEHGRILAELLRPLIRDQPLMLLTDLNGEVARAEAHGYCLTQLGPPAVQVLRTRALAAEVGDVGVASDAVALVYAARCLERRVAEPSMLVAGVGGQVARVVAMMT